MGYYARERIFVGCGPNLISDTPVFAADDLSKDECETLAASVKKYLQSIQQGDWYFDLQPSADEDAAAIINLKSEWLETRSKLDEYRQSSNSWQSDIAWLQDIAAERAEIIREMRSGRTQVVYLQCDSGHGFKTFDRIETLTNGEIETLEAVLNNRLHEMGMILRVIDDWDAEKNAAIYVDAAHQWSQYEESGDDSDDDCAAANQNAFEICREIFALREKPILYSDMDSERDGQNDEIPFADEEEQTDSLSTPSDDLRSSYQDPSNYWRNVWLYEQRKNGLTNASILAALLERGQEFASLESENALRSAISSIALYHRWPEQKGKAGRPRKARADEGSAS